MTIINIERVNNGWVVRPYEPSAYCCPAASEVYVYTNIADLQAALPELLSIELVAQVVTTS